MKQLMQFMIRAYQLCVSPWLGVHCRFEPSCSCYAMQAFERHPPLKATWLTLKRILRCNPLSAPAHDPVPHTNHSYQ